MFREPETWSTDACRYDELNSYKVANAGKIIFEISSQCITVNPANFIRITNLMTCKIWLHSTRL